MARTNLTEKDEGKKVVNADGDTVGMISGFRGGRAHVDPDPDLTDKVKSALGWQDVDDDNYILESDQVERITDDEVHLTRGV